MATRARIDTVSGRARLPVRREPYWQRVRAGIYIGFRQSAGNPAGTWHLRYPGDTQEGPRKKYHALGSLEYWPAHERFDRAREEAEAWLQLLVAGDQKPVDETPSVFDVCMAYVDKIREEKGDEAAGDVAARFYNWIEPDPIATLIFRELNDADVRAWRKRMINAPVRGKAGKPRRRSLDTVNRDMAPVRAAFNYPYARRQIATNEAWTLALRAFKGVSKRRDIYLDIDQRRRLVSCAAPDFADFARGLCLMPARPGALANLTVSSFEPRLNVLSIGKDKAGKNRKIHLPRTHADFIKEVAGNRPPEAPLFVRACGLPWDKESWKRQLHLAVEKAGLPPNTVLLALRHSTITDMVHEGHDLLTIAQISGTSVAMIEKNYGHLRPKVAIEALATLAL